MNQTLSLTFKRYDERVKYHKTREQETKVTEWRQQAGVRGAGSGLDCLPGGCGPSTKPGQGCFQKWEAAQSIF